MTSKSRLLLLAVLSMNALLGQTNWSALAFAEYYYVASHSSSPYEHLNGFQFRRIYLTYDHKVDDRLSVRLRFEAANADFTARSAKATPSVKDASLQWRQGNRTILFGISPTPTFALLEPSWGYRSVAKTPLDLHKMGRSRDFGIAIKTKLPSGFGYHVMIGNGNANASEDNYYKKFFGAVSVPMAGLGIAEVYVDVEEDDPDLTVLTAQLHVQLNLLSYHIGLVGARQIDSDGTTSTNRDLISVYFKSTSSGKMNLFGRMDYLLEPNSDGSKIAYTPMSNSAQPAVIIGGLDLELHENVRFQPNVMAVIYTVEAGGIPSPDIYLRLTSYVKL